MPYYCISVTLFICKDLPLWLSFFIYFEQFLGCKYNMTLHLHPTIQTMPPAFREEVSLPPLCPPPQENNTTAFHKTLHISSQAKENQKPFVWLPNQ